jgi:CelD/BcsL family acetyltransferase involved in cellulose biosynthesis
MTTIEHIEDASRFAALAGEWDALLQRSDAANVFLTWEWLNAWWTHLRGGRRLHLLAVRADGRLAAVAPLALVPPRLGRLVPFRTLQFLGAGTVGSDYLDVIADRDARGDVPRALAGVIGRERWMLELGRVAAGGALAFELSRALQEGSWTCRAAQSETCPFIPLAGHTWDSYLATLGSAHRYNVQRRLRNLQRRYRVELACVTTEAERGPALSRLIALHEARWRGRGRSEAFCSPSLVAFHHDFTRRALERGWLRLLELRLDGRPAAALYGLRYRGTFSFYQSGFDPAFAKDSVGLAMMALAIQGALDEGAAEYDLLHGDESYKSLWAREARALTNLELYPPRLRGLACRQAVGMGRAAARVARRVMPGAWADRLATRAAGA